MFSVNPENKTSLEDKVLSFPSNELLFDFGTTLIPSPAEEYITHKKLDSAIISDNDEFADLCDTPCVKWASTSCPWASTVKLLAKFCKRSIRFSITTIVLTVVVVYVLLLS